MSVRSTLCVQTQEGLGDRKVSGVFLLDEENNKKKKIDFLFGMDMKIDS